MTGRLVRVRAAAIVLASSAVLGACAATAPTGAGTRTSAAAASPWTDDVFALSKAADEAYRDGRWIEAARVYGRLTDAVPDDAYAWFRLGNTFAQQGDYARAIGAYETSLERDAEQPKPWFNLSTAYLLHAQVAMARARDRLRPGDPARAMIDGRLAGLRALMHERIEDVPTRTGIR